MHDNRSNYGWASGAGDNAFMNFAPADGIADLCGSGPPPCRIQGDAPLFPQQVRIVPAGPGARLQQLQWEELSPKATRCPEQFRPPRSRQGLNPGGPGNYRAAALAVRGVFSPEV